MPCHQKSSWSQKDENSDNLVSPPLCLASIVRFEHFRIPSVCLSLPSLSLILSLFLSLSFTHTLRLSFSLLQHDLTAIAHSLLVSFTCCLSLIYTHSFSFSLTFSLKPLSFSPSCSLKSTHALSLTLSFFLEALKVRFKMWQLLLQNKRSSEECRSCSTWDALLHFLWESCHFAATSLEPVLNWLCHFATHDTPRPSCWYRLFWLHGKFMSLEERSFKLFKPCMVKSNSSGRMFP